MERHAAEILLSQARELGAEAAEAFLRSSASTTVEVKEQTVDAFDRARDIGAGLRVLAAGRMGFAFTTDLSPGALRELAAAAVMNARNTEADPFQAIPGKPARPYPEVLMHDPAIAALSEREKIDRVMAMERAAFGVDPRIRRIRKAAASFSESETLIMNSSSAEVLYRGTAVSGSIEAVAEDKGESQAGWDFDVRRFYRDIDIEAIGVRAARKAVDLLGARTIASVKAPVILESSVAQEILSIIAGGFTAESVQKKKSLFAGKLGREILSPLITIVDDGLRAGGLGTAPADDELVPVSTKTIVDKGRLALFLYNTYTARKDKTVSTGNGIRGGFKGLPGVGVTNLFIEPGMHSLDALVADTDRGLFVNEIMGAHTANPISGDFSVGATGFWIEQGRMAYPVREITISGNLLDVLKGVDAVAGDLRFAGRIGSPSLRIRELSIGGK